MKITTFYCCIVSSFCFFLQVVQSSDNTWKMPSDFKIQCVAKQEIRIEDDYISLMFAECPSNDIFQSFLKAANIWSSIIKENKINPEYLPPILNSKQICPFISAFTIFNLKKSDHLRILVDLTSSSAVQVASANVCITDTQYIPIFGGLVVNKNKMISFNSDGLLLPILIHEIFHILGFSRSYLKHLQDNGGFAVNGQSIVEDLIFEGGLINPENSPKFIGSKVRSLMRKEIELDYLPLEDGNHKGRNLFDLTKGEGSGSVDSHFDKDFFGDDLMTFSLTSSKSLKQPFSDTTGLVLRSMGYEIDLEKAALINLESKSSLRGSKSHAKVVSLENDGSFNHPVRTVLEILD